MVEAETNERLPNELIEQRESLKLIKNSRGYNWEIKLIPGSFGHETQEQHVDRLIKINNKMVLEFGSSE